MPIPRPPPLTTATLPVRSNRSTGSSIVTPSVEVTVAGIDDLRVHSQDLGELLDHHVEDELAQLVLVLGAGQQRTAEQHDARPGGRVPRVAGLGGAADDPGQRHAFLADGVEVRHFLDRELHVGQFGLPARLQPRHRLEHDVVELLGPAAVQRYPGRNQPAAQPAAMAITPPRPGPWPRTAFAGLHSYRAYKITPPPGRAHAAAPPAAAPQPARNCE